jgi:hypothetical protein
MKKHKSQRLISIQRVIDEKLEWKAVRVELEEPYKEEWDDIIHTHRIEYQIVDAEGTIYHGIIEEDGRVMTGGGYCRYDSIKIYEAFWVAEDAGMSKRHGPRGRTRHHLHCNWETGEVFGRASSPSSGDEQIYSMNACDVAAWLSDIDNREEPITYDTDPRSIAIGLPIEIVNAIEGQLTGNSIDWIRCILAEALGDIALAGPPVGKPEDGDPAFSAEQVREALDRIKAGEMCPAPDRCSLVTAEQVRIGIDKIKQIKAEAGE